MSAGTINIRRDLWENSQFPNESFSKREAWIWLIAMAAWKPREKRVGDYTVSLERGQLAFSVRFLARAWGWEQTKVVRFLKALETRQNIATDTTTGVKRISICNYDMYQYGPRASATPDAAETQQERNKLEEDKKTITPQSPLEGDEVTTAFKAYCQTAEEVGLSVPMKLTDGRRKALQARLKEFGVDEFARALRHLASSPFLTGKNDRKWKADIDWLLGPKNFVKVLEGDRYGIDRRARTGRPSAPAGPTISCGGFVFPASKVEADVKRFFETDGAEWNGQMGYRPGHPHCEIPDNIIKKYEGARENVLPFLGTNKAMNVAAS